ncbi:MAG: molybdenum cofactor biosynthesis protein MoaE [Bacteroidota bacterium]
MNENIEIKLLESPLSPDSCISFVSDPGAGGMALFIGTVRDATKERKVIRLEFEAYKPMAISEMTKIAQQAHDKWPIKKIAIHHRIGNLSIEEIAVIIAVTTPHRAAAFEACQYAIDTLKQTVPIWKKEIFEDGTVWVSAHP